MNRNPQAKRTVAMMALAIAVFLAMPADAGAANSGAAKAAPVKQQPRTQKTVKQTKKALKAARRQQRQKVEKLTKEMNDMAAMVRRQRGTAGVDLSSQPRESASLNRALNRKINDHAAAKAELNALTKQSYRQFAASRNIEIIPNPPSTPPPPLPSNTLVAPGAAGGAATSIRQSRERRPPGGASPQVVHRPDI